MPDPYYDVAYAGMLKFVNKSMNTDLQDQLVINCYKYMYSHDIFMQQLCGCVGQLWKLLFAYKKNNFSMVAKKRNLFVFLVSRDV